VFESLVIVTREGVEAALVVAIVLASLRRTGAMRYAPWVYAGIAAAVALSITGAIVVPRLPLPPELIEGWALLIGAVCVATLVWWMHRHGRHMKSEIEGGLDRWRSSADGGADANAISAADANAAAPRLPGWGLLLFTAALLFREGLETIVFLAALSFNTDGVSRMIGAALGLLLSALFGVLFVRGTLRVDLRRFFAVTTVILAILAMQLAVGAYHEFAEVGVLPASRESMAIVGPIVRYDSLLFALAVLVTIVLIGRTPRPAAPVPAPANDAERRLREAAAGRDRRVRRSTAVAATSVAAILATGFLSQAQVPAKTAGTPAPLAGGVVRVPIAGLGDGRVHFFETAVEGRVVRFFLARRGAGGDWVACLDACRICGDLGYYEEQTGMTCRNCTAPVNPQSLGQPGGCNPIPLASRLEGGDMVIDATTLRAEAEIFPPAAAAP
jgi:FTR1 family protein